MLNNLKIKLSAKEIDYITTLIIDLKKKQVKEKTFPDWYLKFN